MARIIPRTKEPNYPPRLLAATKYALAGKGWRKPRNPRTPSQQRVRNAWQYAAAYLRVHGLGTVWNQWVNVGGRRFTLRPLRGTQLFFHTQVMRIVRGLLPLPNVVPSFNIAEHAHLHGVEVTAEPNLITLSLLWAPDPPPSAAASIYAAPPMSAGRNPAALNPSAFFCLTRANVQGSLSPLWHIDITPHLIRHFGNLIPGQKYCFAVIEGEYDLGAQITWGRAFYADCIAVAP
jgi:hypothetical protein